MKRAIPFVLLLILGLSLAFDAWGGRLMDLGLERAPGRPLGWLLAIGMVDGAFFLGIKQARLGERLRMRIEVPEELESIEIPLLSLQVLVENAVKHGIASSEQGGEIRICASREDAMLILEVQDPGLGISKHQGTGTALDTLRQRLSNPQDLKLEPTPQGVCASLRWRIA